MVDVQTVSIVIASASVVAGIIYYSFQVRHQTKVRQTDTVMRLYSTYSSNEFREALIKVMSLQFEDYEDYVKKYGPWFSDEPAHKAMAMVAMFFDGVGVLLYKKLIDQSLIYDLFSTAIRVFWEKMKPVMLGLRRESNDPKVFEWFEYLYNEMKRRENNN
jgi:cytochrome c oxidase assembly factor CtaG